MDVLDLYKILDYILHEKNEHVLISKHLTQVYTRQSSFYYPVFI